MRPKVLVSSCGRASNYKQWDEERMKKAYVAVKEKQLSVRKAALSYNIPKSTLSDRVSGRVPFGSHSGPARYLSDGEETQLVHFLCKAASLGYARTKKEVLAIVEELVSAKGKEIHVSNGWWESFRRRHPILTLRSAEKLSYARLVATNPDDLNLSNSNPDGSLSPEVPSNLLLGDQQPKESIISKFFPSIPVTHKPLPYAKTCAKLLTSAEYIKELERKEKLKREKEEEKERRKQERERKKMEKEREKKLTKMKKGVTKKGKKKVQEDVDDGK